MSRTLRLAVALHHQARRTGSETDLDGTRIEIRIHGDTLRDDTPALLTAQEARALEESLLVMADRLERLN